jgi:site-specific DNA-cytosine methylase
MPTLNAFDNGDIRTTILIMRNREGKPGGGKGPMLGEKSFTLATHNDQTLFIFYGNRVDDIRLQGGVINTLQARMGTGGNNMPMVAYPIQDGRDMNKEQNGIGFGEEKDPSYTLDSTGAQSVAYAIQGTVIGRSDTAGPQGKGFAENGEPMFTIDTVGGHAVAIAYDEFNDSIADTHHTLRAGTKQSTGVMMESQVRRLTPLECERLQGFPDDWTAGQSDSARYKQMGNAVAVPVVEWLIGNICDTINLAS